jgi:DNA helicase HerA-like ATPase
MMEIGRQSHKLGRVVAVTGAQIIVLLDSDSAGTLAAGVVQVGHLVKIATVRSQVYGIISGLSIPMPMQGGDAPELKIVEIDLLGEVLHMADGGDGSFRRGISIMPSLDDLVSTADQSDTALVYARPNHQTVCIGTVHQDPRVKAHVGIDDLLGKHFAVVGTTGAGKSCAVTLILKRILERNPNAHILLLDPHGEYARAFGDQAEHLTAESLNLPHWLFNFEEIVEVVFGAEAPDLVTELQCLRELILGAKLRFAGIGRDTSWITVDTPVPYRMGDLIQLLDDALGRLENRADRGSYLRIKSRLAALQSDRRYAFMFPSNLFLVDDLAPLLGRLFRVPVDGRPLAILDLAGVPSEVLNVVVSVLSRMAFDFAFWGDQSVPLLVVCEEAHRYAPKDGNAGFEPTKRALARIAKEGRKYGISLCVVSQRPSELAPSLLSQCNTVFALRMTSHKDQEIIHAAILDASSALMSALPSLGNAEAIAVGEGLPVPMRLRFSELAPDERPRSGTAPFSARWQADGGTANLLEHIVDCWRQQKRDGSTTDRGRQTVG